MRENNNNKKRTSTPRDQASADSALIQEMAWYHNGANSCPESRQTLEKLQNKEPTSVKYLSKFIDFYTT